VKKQTVINLCEKYVCFAVIFSLSFILTIIFLCGSYWVHEIGHWITSLVTNAFLGKPEIPYFSNFLKCIFIPIPQQTTGSKGFSWLMGPLFSITFYLVITFFIWKKFNLNKHLVFIPWVLLFYYEFTGNFLYGTDNPTHLPLFKTEPEIIHFFNTHLFYFIWAAFFTLFTLKFREINKRISRIINPKRKIKNF